MIARSSMASSLPSFRSFSNQLSSPKLRKYPRARYQIFSRYEGNSANNTVDGNLSVLRKRIEGLRKRERILLEKSCRGWDYKSVGYQKRRSAILGESIEVLGSMSSAIALVFLSGSLPILLLSFIVHLCTST